MPEKSLNYDLDLSDIDIVKDLWYGFFPAYYNFKNDIIGGTPTGWLTTTFTSSIVASHYGHANVYLITDVPANGQFRQTWTSAQTSGTVEWWACPGQTNMAVTTIIFNAGYTEAINIRFNNDGNIYAYNGGVNTNLLAYAANTWYHFRVVFDCATDTFDLYINGVLEADDFAFRNAVDSLIQFYMCNSTIQALNMGIDAIDYSWSPGYFTNRNYPPLLAWLLASL